MQFTWKVRVFFSVSRAMVYAVRRLLTHTYLRIYYHVFHAYT